MEIPKATAIETGSYADAKFYEIENQPGIWRRLKKPSKDSLAAVYDVKGLRTGHFEKWQFKPAVIPKGAA